MTNQQNHIKNLVLSALCLAIAMYLPFLTGQIQTIGNMLCPMHIPVFLCAYMCGWKWAAAVGFVSPFIRYSAFGMPPIMLSLIHISALKKGENHEKKKGFSVYAAMSVSDSERIQLHFCG